MGGDVSLRELLTARGLAVDLLGVPHTEAPVAEGLALLVATAEKATLTFERVREEPKVLVPQHRAGSPEISSASTGACELEK